jgi:signal peptidase I
MDSFHPLDSRVLQLAIPSAPCRGNSMRGTLAEGDCLWVSRISIDSLQVGDVVAFDAGGKIVAHRIAGRSETGLLTQGDGNWRRDATSLQSCNLVGRVMERERGGIRSVVVGGMLGRRRAAVLHVLSFLRWTLLMLLAPVYRLVRAGRIAGLLWRPRIMRVRFATRMGHITKFVHRGRTIAYWIPQAKQWVCRKPFDLILAPPI